jgi:hypothetical protein
LILKHKPQNKNKDEKKTKSHTHTHTQRKKERKKERKTRKGTQNDETTARAKPERIAMSFGIFTYIDRVTRRMQPIIDR